jgi:hypothetical protein
VEGWKPFDKPFDASDAAEGDARHIQALVASHGYQDIYLPFMLGLARRWYKELANPSQGRKDRIPDDALRGGIRVIEALISMPNDILREAERRNEEDRQAQAVDDHYESIAREGRGLPGESPYEGLSPSDPI